VTDPLAWIADDRASFVEWLTGQRWYGDKSRTITTVETSVISEIDAYGKRVWLTEVRCHFDDGDESTYFVPLVADGDQLPRDALASPAFRQWLAQGFKAERSVAATAWPGAHLSWEPIPGADVLDWTSTSGTILSGEQSNTSIVYVDKAILKVFRRLQPGINPDSEVVAFLTSRTGYRHVPAFLGSLFLRFDDGRQPVELGAVQAYVANDGDCWRWLTPALATGDSSVHSALLGPVGLLGRRTAELHAALAGVPDLDEFAPQPYLADEAQMEGARLMQEITSTFSMIRRRGVMSIEACDDLESAIRNRVADAGALSGMPRIRVHGDYHLGQVLRTSDDFVIIDFEGEPSRPMAERRQKHSPLKDVAGMLRSLDYAASSALREAEELVGPDLHAWRSAAERDFVQAYRQAILGAPIELVPSDDAPFIKALDLFMIDKALYETRYELDNRPDWVDIPLAGLRRI
jgi:maltose alpha-D-glucosyltransferase/alpha-amylase